MHSKNILLLSFICIAATLSAGAKELIEGYVILKNNDTAKYNINIPKMHDGSFGLFDAVSVQTNTGKVVYAARNKDIKGFGFVYNDTAYDYVLTPISDEQFVFALRLAAGKKLNLYAYYSFGPAQSNSQAKTVILILENADKKIVVITDEFLSPFKKNVKELLKDDPQLLKLFDLRVVDFDDMKNFVVEANKL